jgi:hypothetical protein
MDALRELGQLIWGWLVGVSGEPGFFAGALIGIVGLIVVGFVWFRVKVWWGNVKAPLAPQKIVLTTSKTPAQILTDSCSTLVLGLSVFLCIICLLIEIVSPGKVFGLLQTLGF